MLVYGKNVAKELLKNKRKIKQVFLATNFKDSEIISLLNENNVNIVYEEKYKIDKIEKGNHQGTDGLHDDRGDADTVNLFNGIRAEAETFDVDGDRMFFAEQEKH